MESRTDSVVAVADAARSVVHLESAYDVVDEMAYKPLRYADSLYKLSLLAAKALEGVKRRRT